MRVMIADDAVLFREGLARVLQASGIDVAGQVGDAERRRVERNLHDGAQQRLVNLSLALGIARSQLPGSADGELAVALDEAARELRLALAELRVLFG